MIVINGKPQFNDGNLELANAKALRGRNAADSANIDAVQVNASDQVVVNNAASGAVLVGGQPTALVGFFAGTPVAREPANPDTSAATLPNLEIEVNQLKQLLRNYNLMAP